MTTPAFSIDRSYEFAARVSRKASSSFYPSFWLLSRPKRLAMCAFYAFARLTDDVADSTWSVDRKRDWLTCWRNVVEQTFEMRGCEAIRVPRLDDVRPQGQVQFNAAMEILPALLHTQQQYAIDTNLFLGLIDGAIADQQDVQYLTFDDLEAYCYLVASTVGLVCLQIWGFDGEAASKAAIDCGTGFQLTNILRDLREDLQSGRCYLPLDDLQHYGIDLQRTLNENEASLLPLIEDYCQRADLLYQHGWNVHDGIHADGKPMFSMMWHSYHELLTVIRRDPSLVLDHRVRLPLGSKIRIVAGHFIPAFARARPSGRK